MLRLETRLLIFGCCLWLAECDICWQKAADELSWRRSNSSLTQNDYEINLFAKVIQCADTTPSTATFFIISNQQRFEILFNVVCSISSWFPWRENGSLTWPVSAPDNIYCSKFVPINSLQLKLFQVSCSYSHFLCHIKNFFSVHPLPSSRFIQLERIISRTYWIKLSSLMAVLTVRCDMCIILWIVPPFSRHSRPRSTCYKSAKSNFVTRTHWCGCC